MSCIVTNYLGDLNKLTLIRCLKVSIAFCIVSIVSETTSSHVASAAIMKCTFDGCGGLGAGDSAGACGGEDASDCIRHFEDTPVGKGTLCGFIVSGCALLAASGDEPGAAICVAAAVATGCLHPGQK